MAVVSADDEVFFAGIFENIIDVVVGLARDELAVFSERIFRQGSIDCAPAALEIFDAWENSVGTSLMITE